MYGYGATLFNAKVSYTWPEKAAILAVTDFFRLVFLETTVFQN